MKRYEVIITRTATVAALVAETMGVLSFIHSDITMTDSVMVGIVLLNQVLCWMAFGVVCHITKKGTKVKKNRYKNNATIYSA